LAEEEVWRRFVGPPVAGFRHIGLGLDGSEPAFLHDSADPVGGANNASFGQHLPDSAVAIAAAVALENLLDHLPYLLVGELGGCGLSGMVVAASGHLESDTDPADCAAGGMADLLDHFPELGWGLVPRITAAFFKMSFSSLRTAFSRRRKRRSSASGLSSGTRVASLPGCPLCAARRQLYSRLLLMQSSSASWETGLPVSRSSTAWALNSAV